MNRLTEKVTIGCLLHDVGKLICRADTQDGRNHSQAGYELVSNVCNDDITCQCVRFHHKNELSDAVISRTSPAYIAYISDIIAAGADRRPDNGAHNAGLQKDMPLYSVFNVLNGKSESKSVISENQFDNLPIPTSERKTISADYYKRIVNDIKAALSVIEFNSENINSLMEIVERLTSFVPSGTNTKDLADISLFDHSKMTACIGSCISEFLQSNSIDDYKTELFENEKQFLEKKAFLMVSFDLSGIQSFIYSISYEDALKSLRMRSFFLEIFMEHCIDTLLEQVGLSKTNLIYSGGGHCYILLPNTDDVKTKLRETVSSINHWLIEQFEASLFLASAFVECSGNDLMNKPEQSSPYSLIFRNLSRQLSRIKMNRYSADDIKLLNKPLATSSRECKVCGRISMLDKTEDICRWCDTFSSISSSVFSNSFYVVTKTSIASKTGLSLPGISGDVFMYAVNETQAKEQINSGNAIRVYCKNISGTGLRYANKIFVGDYAYSNRMDKLLSETGGIKRIAVLRMDVDNLGQAFVKGFEQNSPDAETRYRYVTLSRTAAFSRQLSMFFKYYINKILEENKEGRRYRVSIVYSGGDDVFLLGAWEDVIQSAIRISDAFKKYSMNRLTVSAGIGIFGEKYPIFKSAKETEELEAKSKSVPGKNSVTLFTVEEDHTYNWDKFKDKVMDEKLKLLKGYLDTQESELGNSFLYRILNLLRNSKEKVNIARYAYLLVRMEPKKKEHRQSYANFSKKMYEWIRDEADKQQLITAIYIYIYQKRNGSESK